MFLVTNTHNALWYMKKANFWLVRGRWDTTQSKTILHFAVVRVSWFFEPFIIHDLRLRGARQYSSALKFSVRTTGIWFVMDFYKDKAKLIDKLLEEGPTSTEEEDEALVTLKRESRMQNKFFACHVVVLVLVLVLGMCLFARVAYYGFQTTEYDQQSLNGGLFILILGHSIYCRLSLYWRYFYTYSGPQRCQPRFFNPATPTKIFPLSRNPERFHRPIPIPVTSFTVNPLKIYFISRPFEGEP